MVGRRIWSLGLSLLLMVQSFTVVLCEEEQQESEEETVVEVESVVEQSEEGITEQTIEQEAEEVIVQEEEPELFVEESEPIETESEEVDEVEACEEPEEELSFEIVEEVEEAERVALYTSVGDVKITVCGFLPVQGSVTVEEVELTLSAHEVLGAYDITILDEDGKVFEPKEEPVHVAIELPSLKEEEAQALQVHHLSSVTAENASEVQDEDLNEDTLVQAKVENHTIEFETDGFSVYVLDAPIVLEEVTAPVEVSKIYLDCTGKRHAEEAGALVCTDLQEAVEKAKEKGIAEIYVCSAYRLTPENVGLVNDASITFVRCAENRGHVFVTCGDVVFNAVHVDGQSVEANRALVSVGSGTLTITGIAILENGVNIAYKDGGYGGAVLANGANLIMTGGILRHNKAIYGGGIYAQHCTVVLEGGELLENEAQGANNSLSGESGHGGGLYVLSNKDIATAVVKIGVNGGNTKIIGNSAVVGGGVYLCHGTGHEIYTAEFKYNSATRTTGVYDGGGLYVDKETSCSMKNVYVVQNRTVTGFSHPAAVASCPTGSLRVKGAYVENDSKNDIQLSSGGKASVSTRLLGGMEAHYTKGRGGEEAPASYHQHTKDFFEVKTNPTDQADEVAWANASVVFSGNTCRQTGSAIMTNGKLKITADMKDLTVNKVWSDGQEMHKDDSVEVQLQYFSTKMNAWVDVLDGSRSDARQVLNAENGWSCTWKELGPKVEWRAVEVKSVPGYSVRYGKVDTDGRQKIENVKNEGSITVKKSVEGSPTGASYAFVLRLNELVDTFAIPYEITRAGQKEFGVLEVDQDCAELKFALGHGDQLVVQGLPMGSVYEVSEATGNYTTYVGGNKTSVVTGVLSEEKKTVEYAYLNILPPVHEPTSTPEPVTQVVEETPEIPYTPKTGRMRPYTPNTNDETGLLDWGIWLVLSLGVAVAAAKVMNHK